ncbi:hypothetical protein EXIGLDRAFT_770738 [Exidia glandulosa HHB12029]|uniref:Uncharacterized protein n=1 Tax=Exidia glandulosa HHB12029 TaxID=1314781 RepID=A0A166ABY3_EXIGL|nr:hypothetical protein EXIGLDRAFT_770738 [Exidia glandulosa HHB12029]
MSLNRLPAAAAKLVPKLTALEGTSGSLYQVLSRLPQGGVGSKVLETRWSGKGFKDCYWLVSRTRFKADGVHGKAYGQLYWRGKPIPINQMPNKPPLTELLIRGGLKRRWRVFTEKDMSSPDGVPENDMSSPDAVPDAPDATPTPAEPSQQ